MSDVIVTERRVVLVTGASTGFGRLMVEALARRGHHVFAALRDLSGRNAQAAAELATLASAEALDLQVVELDVTDQSSADRAIEVVMASKGRIDVVVNNAGMIFPGPVEAFTAEEAHRQFDVNVLGALRVNRAALPYLRRQGRGALIQIGSLSGRVSLPFSGLYAASKAALGSLTEAWHHELAPFGVESVIVDAASYPTNIGVNAALPADTARMGVYGDSFSGYVTAIGERAAKLGGDPRVVSDAVVDLVEAAEGHRRQWTIVAPSDQYEAVDRLAQQKAEAAGIIAVEMGVDSFLARAEQ
ncbi:SDR family oxidoreductase [Micromonospora ureilytica]|uniref:SDR family oxidoreductase n=1 Tax=Micromonospora ureilytica TaxID=709868 RepID=UPI002E0D51C6|nr:SDR family oxidoreductase [Micromonospora ureilytica]